MRETGAENAPTINSLRQLLRIIIASSLSPCQEAYLLPSAGGCEEERRRGWKRRGRGWHCFEEASTHLHPLYSAHTGSILEHTYKREAFAVRKQPSCHKLDSTNQRRGCGHRFALAHPRTCMEHRRCTL